YFTARVWGVMVTIDTRLTNGPTGGPLANPTRNAALTTGSGAGRFRGLRSAASLKHRSRWTPTHVENRFRGLRSAASLKHVEVQGGERLADSADSDPRPH